jgi:hypothetical protein
MKSEFNDYSDKFSNSMMALEDLSDIVLLIYEFQKTVWSNNKKKHDIGKNISDDFENVAAISDMIIKFTEKYTIKNLIIKADLINMFKEFIKYADSICDFKQLRQYKKDSIFPIIIAALKKSHHFKDILKIKNADHFVNVNKMLE